MAAKPSAAASESVAGVRRQHQLQRLVASQERHVAQAVSVLAFCSSSSISCSVLMLHWSDMWLQLQRLQRVET